jgi:hypothetical protein
MKIKRYKLKYDLTRGQCPWLNEVFTMGQIFFQSRALTYGCISKNGIACTLHESGYGEFFEIPKSALEEIKDIE